MSNDLIKRGNLKKQILEYVRTHVVPTVTGVLALIEDAPAVPREMSAIEFMKLRSRICHEQYINRQSDDDWLCDGCVLKACCSPADSEGCEADAVAIVEAWAQEHPERSEE